jgi:hypothetical protein
MEKLEFKSIDSVFISEDEKIIFIQKGRNSPMDWVKGAFFM